MGLVKTLICERPYKVKLSGWGTKPFPVRWRSWRAGYVLLRGLRCLPASSTGVRERLIQTPPSVGLVLTLLVGLVMRDVALARDEVVGLMAGLPTSEAGPTCTIRLSERLAENGDGPGRRVRINWHR